MFLFNLDKIKHLNTIVRVLEMCFLFSFFKVCSEYGETIGIVNPLTCILASLAHTQAKLDWKQRRHCSSLTNLKKGGVLTNQSTHGFSEGGP